MEDGSFGCLLDSWHLGKVREICNETNLRFANEYSCVTRDGVSTHDVHKTYRDEFFEPLLPGHVDGLLLGLQSS